MNKFSVAVDEELYFTSEQPKCVAEQVEGVFPTQYVNFIEFVSSNGPTKGQRMRVPLERIVWISEELSPHV